MPVQFSQPIQMNCVDGNVAGNFPLASVTFFGRTVLIPDVVVYARLLERLKVCFAFLKKLVCQLSYEYKLISIFALT